MTDPHPALEAWAPTQALTRTPAGKGAGAGPAADGLLGARTAADRHEIFAACPPGEALALALHRQQPALLVLHDIGQDAASRAVLQELAAGLQLPLQHLAIRRQGSGVTLATLPFVSLPMPGAWPLHVVSTQVEADGASRAALTAVLLGQARLGALLIAPMPDHAVTSLLAPLRDAVHAPTWSSRHLLAVPIGAGALAQRALGQWLHGSRSALAVAPAARTAPAAWNAIQAEWERLRLDTRPVATSAWADTAHGDPDALDAALAAAASRVGAPTEPLPMRPMPAIAGRAQPVPRPVAPRPAPGNPLLRPGYEDAEGDVFRTRGVFNPADIAAARRGVDSRPPSQWGHSAAGPLSDPTARLRSAPMPATQTPQGPQGLVQAICTVSGVVSAAVMERASGRLLAAADSSRSEGRGGARMEHLAPYAVHLMAAAAALRDAVGTRDDETEAMASAEPHLLYVKALRAPAQHAAIAVWIERSHANPALLRSQIQRFELHAFHGNG